MNSSIKRTHFKTYFAKVKAYAGAQPDVAYNHKLNSINLVPLNTTVRPEVGKQNNMHTITITLRIENKPITIKLIDPGVTLEETKSNCYGQIASNRLLLDDNNTAVCLFLDDCLTTEQLEEIVARYSCKKPTAINFDYPFMAIHAIQHGLGWPHHKRCKPTSLFSSRPAKDWLVMYSKPPVAKEHPLLNQPDGTVWIMGYRPHGEPISFHYDSIAKIAHKGTELVLTINPKSETELVGAVALRLVSKQAATELAKDLRLRQVRCIRHNETILAMTVLAHGAACKLGARPYISGSNSNSFMIGFTEMRSLLNQARLTSPEVMAKHIAYLLKQKS